MLVIGAWTFILSLFCWCVFWLIFVCIFQQFRARLLIAMGIEVSSRDLRLFSTVQSSAVPSSDQSSPISSSVSGPVLPSPMWDRDNFNYWHSSVCGLPFPTSPVSNQIFNQVSGPVLYSPVSHPVSSPVPVHFSLSGWPYITCVMVFCSILKNS